MERGKIILMSLSSDKITLTSTRNDKIQWEIYDMQPLMDKNNT